MTENIERRLIDNAELRLDEQEGKTPTVAGYAALFNTDSKVLFQRGKGTFIERIEPNAFSWQDVRALVNHDSNQILARARGAESDTMQLTQDARGLHYSFELDMSNPNAQALHSALKRKDIDQSSFAFIVPKGGDTWGSDDEGRQVRTIHQATCLDCSPVVYPAYQETTVDLRSYDAWVEGQKEAENTEADSTALKAEDAAALQVRIQHDQTKQEQIEAEAKFYGFQEGNQ